MRHFSNQTITEEATLNEPNASSSAGIQKRVRNLAAEELLIEVITVWGEIFR